MKKYKEEAYKGYLKFVKENRHQKIVNMAWLDYKNLRVEIEAPVMISSENNGKLTYFFCPKTSCLINFSTKEKRDHAKKLVYSALWRMNKEIDEKVEGRPQ